MGLEEILDRILSSRKDLGRSEVLRMIEDKRKAAGGYFTAEAAASIVASELGVEIPREPFRPEVSIHDLVSGLNDVTVVGRVIVVYPPKTFTRPDQTEGKVSRLLIADKSGTSRVVLWDDKAILAEVGKIGQGQVVRVSHAYVRQGLDGKLELHVGLRGDIQASPSDVDESEYPSITNFTEKIGKITRKHRRANVVGIVQIFYPISEFKRKDGTPGKVRRLELRDDTGQTTVVVWNEKVDELASVEKGNSLRIMNAKVKECFRSQTRTRSK